MISVCPAALAGGTNSPEPYIGVAGVTSIAAGSLTSFALKSDGTVWAWGYNPFGQLGDGTTDTSATPVQVRLTAETGAGCIHLSSNVTDSLVIGYNLYK